MAQSLSDLPLVYCSTTITYSYEYILRANTNRKTLIARSWLHKYSSSTLYRLHEQYRQVLKKLQICKILWSDPIRTFRTVSFLYGTFAVVNTTFRFEKLNVRKWPFFPTYLHPSDACTSICPILENFNFEFFFSKIQK